VSSILAFKSFIIKINSDFNDGGCKLRVVVDLLLVMMLIQIQDGDL
jgi:hypothetical protein